MKRIEKLIILAAVLAVLASPAAFASAVQEVSAQVDGVSAQIAALQSDLTADDIPSALEISGGAGGGNLFDTVSELHGLIGDYFAEVSNISSDDVINTPGLQDALDAAGAQSDSFTAATADALARLREFFVKIGTNQFTGPGDVNYIADRNKLLSVLDGYVGDLAAIKTAIADADAVNTVTLPPIVRLNLQSVGCGLSFADETITTSGETCRVTASLMNTEPAGGADLASLSVQLDLYSSLATPDNGATDLSFLTPASIDVSSLPANTSVPLSWDFSYSGDMSFENLLLDLDVFENGDTPTSFAANSQESHVSVLADPDNDGLPSKWETDNGLDPAVADADGDLDGDGASNGDEYDMGTDPQNPDTDGDGLLDGEEIVIGKNNAYITDPLNPDTDGDGVNDNSDGNPLDPQVTKKGTPLPEPIVGVSRMQVILSNDEPSASVQVVNAGEGVLRWGLWVGNDAIASTNPGPDSMQTGSSYFAIGAPYDGYDFSQTAGAETVVRVVDLGGSVKDYQEIRVCHVACGGSGGGGGGTTDVVDTALYKLSAPKSAKCAGGPISLSVTVRNNGSSTVDGTLEFTGTADVAGEVFHANDPLTLLDTAKRGLTSVDYSFDPAGLLATAQTVTWNATISFPGDVSDTDNTAIAATKFQGSCP